MPGDCECWGTQTDNQFPSHEAPRVKSTRLRAPKGSLAMLGRLSSLQDTIMVGLTQTPKLSSTYENVCHEG